MFLPSVFETPVENKKLMLEFKGDNKTIVDWVSGRAKLDTWECSIVIA